LENLILYQCSYFFNIKVMDDSKTIKNLALFSIGIGALVFLLGILSSFI